VEPAGRVPRVNGQAAGGGGSGGGGGGGGGDNVGYIHVSFRFIPVLSSLSLLLQAVFPSL